MIITFNVCIYTCHHPTNGGNFLDMAAVTVNHTLHLEPSISIGRGGTSSSGFVLAVSKPEDRTDKKQRAEEASIVVELGFAIILY